MKKSFLYLLALALFTVFPALAVADSTCQTVTTDTVASAVEVIYSSEARPVNAEKIGEVELKKGSSKHCDINELIAIAKSSALERGGNAIYLTISKSPVSGKGCYQMQAEIYKLQQPYSSVLNPDADLMGTTTYNKGVALTEIMPSFPGGFDEMINFFNRNFSYPKSALKNKVAGLLVVTYIVDETGKLKNIEVKQGLRADLDQEAVRTISLMPEWTPGFQNGKAVPVRFTFPVKIKMK